ncbi:MAG TPA: hypothetical protein VK920_06555 [Solirubrobacterales bacterium]|nr:hypothetical protein [Solirubrobacterales bacterium]
MGTGTKALLIGAALLPVMIVAVAFASWNALTALGPSFEIPSGPAIDPPPSYLGAPASSRPIDAARVPQHPYMAPNGRSSIHSDAYMSDTNEWSGPLGRDPETRSTFQVGECATVTFDSEGRIVTLCVRPVGRFVAMIESDSLDRVATFDLPDRAGGLGALLAGDALTDFTGGGYFYLDHRDRAVVPTTTRHVYVIAQTEEPGFELERDIDLTAVISEDDGITSVLPDWDGRLWFVTADGTVGTVPRGGARAGGAIGLGEDIENSFAVDEAGGVFVVSDEAMYRFDAGPGGAPEVSWRRPYPNSGEQKPGQSDDGSGTTPTLLGRRWVGIADNAKRLGVVVYDRRREPAGRRIVCRRPVFEPGRGATENSLIAAGRSFLVENNYGYAGPASTLLAGTTEPGFARVDVDHDGRGCELVWESDVRAPSVVPKLSLATGLVYTYTKPAGATSAPWYLTALDFRTGRTAFEVQAGRGYNHNNHYAPVTLGPDGGAYVGALAGLIRVADGG